MHEKRFLWRRFKRPQPAKKLLSIGMVAELFQRSHLGTDGNNLRENTHGLCSAFDDLAARPRRLKANEQDLVARIRQSQKQMVKDASAGDHAAGGNDDAGITDFIDLPRIFLFGSKVESVPVQRRTIFPDELFRLFIEFILVLQEDFYRLDGHRAINKDRNAGNPIGFKQLFDEEQEFLGALHRESRNHYRAAALNRP